MPLFLPTNSVEEAKKKRHMSSHGKYLMFNVFCASLKDFKKDVI